MIRVTLVSDVRLNREGIAALLAGRDGIEVTVTDLGWEARDGEADVIVIDASAEAGMRAIRSTVDTSTAPVVVFAAPEGDEEVIELAELGVIGFVDREGDLGELVTGIERAAREEASFSPRVGTALLRRINSVGPRPRSSEMGVLTMREREVVHLVAEGLTNKEIAQRLCIEVATVKNHVHNILGKLEVDGRSEAVARLQIAVPAAPGQGIQILG
ncbi:MAG TPA: response regulator transcription factor [Solirubrobacterales bacterium]|nr:response regulator transcription factor [Solirubrobacterales bacterium]